MSAWVTARREQARAVIASASQDRAVLLAVVHLAHAATSKAGRSRVPLTALTALLRELRTDSLGTSPIVLEQRLSRLSSAGDLARCHTADCRRAVRPTEQGLRRWRDLRALLARDPDAATAPEAP